MLDDIGAIKKQIGTVEKDIYEYEDVDQSVFKDANLLVQWLENHECSENEKKTEESSSAKEYVLCQYGVDGDLIKQYSSYGEASIVSRVPVRMIQKAVSGYSRSAGGFQWRRYNGSEIANIIPSLEYEVTNIAQPIQQVSLDGKIVATYDSVRMAVKMTGINRRSIRAVLDGTQKTAGGYYWVKTGQD